MKEKFAYDLRLLSDYICTYKTVPLSTFSNTEIESDTRNLASLQSDEDCRHDCDEDPNCYGFTYFRSSSIPVRWTCKFMSGLPMLATDDISTIFMKTCPPGTTYEGMDNDVVFCLQLLSETLTCTLHLS